MNPVKTAPPPPARRPRSLETERRLKAAVIALLDEGGLEACTAPAIAARAGVAVGTIYARYPDKDALVATALLDMVSLADGAEAAYGAMVEDARDLEAFLRTVTSTAVTVTREHRTLLLAMREFVRRSSDAAWRAAFKAVQGRGRTLIRDAAVKRFGPSVRGGKAALSIVLAVIYGAVEVTWLEPSEGLFDKTLDPGGFTEALVEMQLRYLA
jgi:AcrR family transcriptional regulator